MKTILVNGKPKIAYAIFKTGEAHCDYSYLMKRAVDIQKRDIFSIFFQPNWTFTFPLYNQPAGTVLTLDNIARIDYKLQPKFLEWSGNPKQKQQDFERLKHADPPQFIFGNTLEWDLITLLLPSERTTKERVEVIGLPDGSTVKVKVPKGKTYTFESHFKGAKSPIKILTIDEQAAVERLIASERKVTDIAKAPQTLVKKAVNEAIAPIVETFKKAIRHSTSPSELQKWQNLKTLYDRQSEPTEGAKWRAVAHIVVMGATEESKKPYERDRQSDYLKTTALNRLIRKLNATGAIRAKIEKDCAETLRREVAREEQKAKKLTKTRV